MRRRGLRVFETARRMRKRRDAREARGLITLCQQPHSLLGPTRPSYPRNTPVLSDEQRSGACRAATAGLPGLSPPRQPQVAVGWTLVKNIT